MKSTYTQGSASVALKFTPCLIMYAKSGRYELRIPGSDTPVLKALVSCGSLVFLGAQTKGSLHKLYVPHPSWDGIVALAVSGKRGSMPWKRKRGI